MSRRRNPMVGSPQDDLFGGRSVQIRPFAEGENHYSVPPETLALPDFEGMDKSEILEVYNFHRKRGDFPRDVSYYAIEEGFLAANPGFNKAIGQGLSAMLVKLSLVNALPQKLYDQAERWISENLPSDLVNIFSDHKVMAVTYGAFRATWAGREENIESKEKFAPLSGTFNFEGMQSSGIPLVDMRQAIEWESYYERWDWRAMLDRVGNVQTSGTKEFVYAYAMWFPSTQEVRASGHEWERDGDGYAKNVIKQAKQDLLNYIPPEERVVWTYSDGSYILELQPQEMVEEGQEQGMCIGQLEMDDIQENRDYWSWKREDGNINTKEGKRFFSLRTPAGRRRFTIEVDPTYDPPKVEQVKGKGNRYPGQAGEKFKVDEVKKIGNFIFHYIQQDPVDTYDMRWGIHQAEDNYIELDKRWRYNPEEDLEEMLGQSCECEFCDIWHEVQNKEGWPFEF